MAKLIDNNFGFPDQSGSEGQAMNNSKQMTKAGSRLALLLASTTLASGAVAQERASVAPPSGPTQAPITIQQAPPSPPRDLPTGGRVVSGSATVSTNGSTMRIDQSTDRLIANWESFSIGDGYTVVFNQPNGQSVALNRVVGQDPSHILGNLVANGQVFLINPNGIVIGLEGRVETGGFVGTTLGIADEDFLAGNYQFRGTGGSILNQGDLQGGVVALIAPTVVNDGLISGETALAAGTGVTLDFDGDGLISIEVSASDLATLVENNGLIQADGGLAILTARGVNDAMRGVVNNTGVVEASSIGERDGRIFLLGDMDQGQVNAAGTLAADFVETSAANVKIDDALTVDTNAGTWLIDPNDFTIAETGGNISGTALSNNLANGNVTITTATQGTPNGNGDIFVNDTVTWSSNILTLNADRSIFINTEMFASGTAGLASEYAQTDPSGDYFINAPVNLASTGSFSTRRGANAPIDYVIITELGDEGSFDDGTLQGLRGDLSANAVLGRTLDASETATWNNGSGFTPIGTADGPGSSDNYFKGRFDGLGHTIDSLFIFRPEEDAIGLFGAILGEGRADPAAALDDRIRNTYLTNVNITGNNLVGGMAGIGASTFTNVHVGGSVSGPSTLSLEFGNSRGVFIGGVLGALSSTPGIDEVTVQGIEYNAAISSSSAEVAIGNAVFAGGLVADLKGNITDSSSSGSVVAAQTAGGLVGISDSSRIEASWSTADVSIFDSPLNADEAAGGLLGASSRTNIIRSFAEGNVAGLENVGGLVGSLSGMVSQSYSSGAVSGQSRVGGLVGVSFTSQSTSASTTEVRESYSTGSVSGTGLYAGGLIGFNDGDVINSFATGDVTGNFGVGGLLGHSSLDDEITNTYATGRVTGNSTVGALIGEVFDSIITASFFDTEATGQTNAFGFVGSGTQGDATGLTSAQMRDSSIFIDAGWDFENVWGIDPEINDGLPFLRATQPVDVAPPPPSPPSPPPPPAPDTLTLDPIDNLTTDADGFQPTINLTGSAFDDVTEIVFQFTDPNGVMGTVTWNPANDFGGGRFAVGADGETATIMPVLVAAGDPTGVYQWTVTINTDTQSVSQSFTVTYTASPPPPPPPPPPPSEPSPLTLTSDLDSDFEVGSVPFQPTVQLVGSGFDGVTEVAFLVTDPAGNVTPIVWNEANGLLQDRFDASSDRMATIMPVLLGANDAPGTYRWTVSITNGDEFVLRNFTVIYAVQPVQEPIINVNPGAGTGGSGVVFGYVGGTNDLGSIDDTTAGSTALVDRQIEIDIALSNYRADDQFGVEVDIWEVGLSQTELASGILPYALMAEDVYGGGSAQLAGWTRVASWEQILVNGLLAGGNRDQRQIELAIATIRETGFNAQLYERGGKYVLAFEGTDIGSWPDILTNLQQFFGNTIGNQYDFALVIADLAQSLSGASIELTGHSLGGGLAQYVASQRPQFNAITFNAAGIRSGTSGSSSNVINVRVTGDPISSGISTKQLGARQIDYPGANALPVGINHPIAVVIDAIVNQIIAP